MKITVNGRELLLENSLSIKNLINHLNIDADIFIVNSFPVSLSYIINNNDTVTLIKKGSIPDKEYLEYQLICRPYTVSKNFALIPQLSWFSSTQAGGAEQNAVVLMMQARFTF